jgi:DNA polymerase-1
VARQFGTLDALLENADKIGGVVGGNLREHRDDVGATARSTGCCATSSCRHDRDLEVQPMDAQGGA